MRKQGLATLLALMLASCGGDDDEPSCQLSCGTQSTMRADVPTVGLYCGTQPLSCNLQYDQFSRVTSMSCSYANGKFASCSNVMYNSLGQIVGGTCNGGGQTCALP